ncbi:MAG: sigma-54-dependent Fis family transcriptional regulator [Deltaproteobacteria bacterium]|nr:sigma-54-dependent Fis family transcriptional regulator [Deltaproteobacteria bacterium]
MKLLLAEDDRIVRIPVRDALRAAGFAVTDCGDGAAALRAAEAEAHDIVLSDVRLPGLDGISLFRKLRQVQPDVAVLLMTAHADAADAVAVMREGARDYIVKPFEIEELVLRIGRVRQELEFRRRLEAGGPTSEATRHPIRGVSSAVRRLLDGVEAAAASDVSVLITGETGTGKDLCARVIHERSRRAGKPFVAVNCAAIPESLFEAELFGHEKGAFTGAERRRLGRFEVADGGTLFLDEVAELAPTAQVKLLRVLEAGAFEPVGSSHPVKVDVRVIAATNRDLQEQIARGAFRSDLFYRLNVIDIATPPLRERRADIPLLVRDFLDEIAARLGRPVPALDPGAVAALSTYDFPGNVRELLHALERAVAMSRGDVIRLAHLPPALGGGGGAGGDAAGGATGIQPLARAVEEFELQYIRHVLAKVGGHRGRAAELLGISRKSLWQRLREEPPAGEE